MRYDVFLLRRAQKSLAKIGPDAAIFRTAMSERRFLYQAGWWTMFVGLHLYLFFGIAFVSGAIFGAGALLAVLNAEKYPQRKAGVLVLLNKVGLRESPNGKGAL